MDDEPRKGQCLRIEAAIIVLVMIAAIAINLYAVVR